MANRINYRGCKTQPHVRSSQNDLKCSNLGELILTLSLIRAKLRDASLQQEDPTGVFRVVGAGEATTNTPMYCVACL